MNEEETGKIIRKSIMFPARLVELIEQYKKEGLILSFSAFVRSAALDKVLGMEKVLFGRFVN